RQSASMDRLPSKHLLNLGSANLSMRILFGNNYGSAASTVALVIPPDDEWHRVVFGLTPADLTLFSGNLSDALQHMGTVQIRHQSGLPMGTGGSTPISSSIGIDNIQAVPEPGSFLAAIPAVAFLRGTRKKGENT